MQTGPRGNSRLKIEIDGPVEVVISLRSFLILCSLAWRDIVKIRYVILKELDDGLVKKQKRF